MRYTMLIAVFALLVLAACQASVQSDTQADAQSDAQNSDDTTQADAAVDASANVQADIDTTEVVDAVNEMVNETMDTATDAVDMADDAATELAEKFAAQDSLEFQVDYDMTTTTQGTTTTGTMSQYFKGVNMMRVDSTIQGVTSQTYIVDGTVTSCVNMGSWMCNDAGEYEMQVGVSEDAQANADTGVRIADKTIAGVSADCFTITTDDGAADYCFSPESVPLYIQTRDGNGNVISTLTATSYSLSVSESVFEPPVDSGDAVAGAGMDYSQYMNQ